MRTRGTTTERGYDYRHQQERKRLQPYVDAGMATCQALRCVMVSRYIPPGSLWDLGHNDDRTAWTGPEHRRCNRAAGARKKNRRRIYRVY